MNLSPKTALAAVAVVVAGGMGVAVLQLAQDDSACERYQAVVSDVERAERGQGDMTFPEAQGKLAEALTACMQEEADTGE